MSKLVSLNEAIQSYVHDGDTIYAAGFTHLIPFAAGHEIIRQGRKDLTLARATPDLIYDLMVAAGCARKVIFSYSGNPGVGSLKWLREGIQNGTLEWEEYSHFGMISRLSWCQRFALYAHAPNWRCGFGAREPAIPARERPLWWGRCNCGAGS